MRTITSRAPRTKRRLPVGRRTSAVLIAVSLLGVACSRDSESSAPLIAPNVATVDRRAGDNANRPNVSIHWNEVARSLVASHNLNGPMASRAYALVSVAQFGAVVALDDDRGDRDDARGDDHRHGAPVDAASAAVIAAAIQEDAQRSNGEGHGGPAAGDAIGASVAQAVLTRAATDGAAAANCPATPPLPPSQFWHDDAVPPNPQPLLPCFGRVHTWLNLDVTQFRADPPPAVGSPAFLAGLAVVRQISNTRTAAQLAIVDAWLDGANTFQPPGRWNLIASDLAARHRFGAAEAARLFAVLNIAEMDTHVACWDRKYTYWELRPWMADPLITTPRGQPHHPGNPSGHACAGGAGSGAVAGFFPAQRDSILALGNEQGFSTVLAGTHFQFDVDKGLEIGRAIAVKALAVRDLGALLSGR